MNKLTTFCVASMAIANGNPYAQAYQPPMRELVPCKKKKPVPCSIPVKTESKLYETELDVKVIERTPFMMKQKKKKECKGEPQFNDCPHGPMKIVHLSPCVERIVTQEFPVLTQEAVTRVKLPKKYGCLKYHREPKSILQKAREKLKACNDGIDAIKKDFQQLKKGYQQMSLMKDIKKAVQNVEHHDNEEGNYQQPEYDEGNYQPEENYQPEANYQNDQGNYQPAAY